MNEHVQVKNPKVSVVIPTYNYGRFLRESIQSVVDQTFQDWELIVVDDGSTDGTSAVVVAFKDPRIRYARQEHRGHASAYNRGVQLARGAYVAFLDADDIWLPKKLAKQVAQLDNLPPTVGLVYSDVSLFNHRDGSTIGRLLDGRTPPRGRIVSYLLHGDWGWFICTSTAVVRRAVFDRVGLFDESLRGHVDKDMSIRIAVQYEVDVLNETLARYRIHSSNLSKDTERMYWSAQVLWLKVLNTLSLRPDERQMLRRGLGRLHFGYAITQLHRGNQREVLRALLRSLRSDPTALWHYPRAALLLVSPRLYGWLRAGKRRLTQRTAQPFRRSGREHVP